MRSVYYSNSQPKPKDNSRCGIKTGQFLSTQNGNMFWSVVQRVKTELRELIFNMERKPSLFLHLYFKYAKKKDLQFSQTTAHRRPNMVLSAAQHRCFYFSQTLQCYPFSSDLHHDGILCCRQKMKTGFYLRVIMTFRVCLSQHLPF